MKVKKFYQQIIHLVKNWDVKETQRHDPRQVAILLKSYSKLEREIC
jgi:hypothetical protein